ncbi:transposase [Nitrospira sp. Kam-Ns4a]
MSSVSDLFGRQGRAVLATRLAALPPQTADPTERLLGALDALEDQIQRLEQRLREVFTPEPSITLLQTLPGVGLLLAVVIASEVGASHRCPGPQHLAAYAGTTPRGYASGGKTRDGPLRPAGNRDLRLAFVEAAHATCRVRKGHAPRQVSRLYERLVRHKGHAKAIGAVARHLAEATYWVLTKQISYRDPAAPGVTATGSSMEASAREWELRASTLARLIATRFSNNLMLP